MASTGQLRMLVVVCFAAIVVSPSRAHVYFSSGDETKPGLEELAEYLPEGDGKDDQVVLIDGGKDGDVPDWEEGGLPAGLAALKHSLQSKYSSTKRAWLPGTKTGLYGKRGSHWMSPEKRQLWANQQSGIFGKREGGLVLTPPRWTVKRSAEEGKFGRQRRKGGGVPHVFQSGGIFGKRSAEQW